MGRKRETTRGMMPLKLAPNTSEGPESIIRGKIITKLEALGWFCKITHGNMYQSGFPDLFCCHLQRGIRLIEVKNPLAFSFTPAQQIDFPKFKASGVGIWILFSDSDDEIAKLAKPANWQEIFLQWSLNGMRQFR